MPTPGQLCPHSDHAKLRDRHSSSHLSETTFWRAFCPFNPIYRYMGPLMYIRCWFWLIMVLLLSRWLQVIKAPFALFLTFLVVRSVTSVLSHLSQSPAYTASLNIHTMQVCLTLPIFANSYRRTRSIADSRREAIQPYKRDNRGGNI